MKNRTIIGVICMVIAVCITFIVAPLVNRITDDTVEVIRLSADIPRGGRIEESQLETVKVKADTIPKGIITDKKEIIGQYAAAELFAGDYITKAKLTSDSNTADDVFASLDGDKIAVSITIDNFALGLSGKLMNGDIISIIITENGKEKAIIPPELKYVRVITTTTPGGVDKDAVIKNEDGTYDMPSTITLLVSERQARLLAKYEKYAYIQTALVYRGKEETANKFLAVQQEYLDTVPEQDDEEEETDAEDTDNNGDDIIKRANDIINGRADYYGGDGNG